MTDTTQPPGAESEALTRYRAASRRRTGTPTDRRRSVVRSMNGRTPAGPVRDPQLVSDVWRSLADAQGWTLQLAVWALANRWPQIVGPQVADHVAVASFDPTPQPARLAGQGAVQQSLLEDATESVLPAGGTLTLRADAAVWQKQLLWNLADLQRRLDLELGRGVVGRIVILGPVERRRSYGPRRVRS
jgi:predicted nucleic acid-binding Zn ribbon protein